MTDRLSEVARALWDAGPKNQDPLGVILVEYFDGYTLDEIKTLVLPLYAKAAIASHDKALEEQGLVIVPREPSKEMLLAGARSIGKTMGVANHIERSRPCWQAMLAALKGKDE